MPYIVAARELTPMQASVSVDKRLPTEEVWALC